MFWRLFVDERTSDKRERDSDVSIRGKLWGAVAFVSLAVIILMWKWICE
jgi:hypothetical protein